MRGVRLLLIILRQKAALGQHFRQDATPFLRSRITRVFATIGSQLRWGKTELKSFNLQLERTQSFLNTYIKKLRL